MGELAKVFGKKVRALRADRGLTQPQLADLANLSEVWLRQIEAGDASPSFKTIEALAKALQADPAELFSGATLSAPVERFTDAVGPLNDEEINWLITGARLLRSRRSGQ